MGKRKMLTLEEKVKVLRLNEKGEKAKIISLSMEVGMTQIYSICRNRDAILKEWESGNTSSQRKILKPRRQIYADLNERIWEWFTQKRSMNTPLYGNLIQEHARHIVIEMGYDNFTASNGWLYCFQQRHSISPQVLRGEATEVKEATVEEWVKDL